MTRNQRRKVAATRKAERLERIASAELARRNASIIARNVGAMRHGERFETSGSLGSCLARPVTSGHSGRGHVFGETPSAATPMVRNDPLASRKFLPTGRNK